MRDPCKHVYIDDRPMTNDRRLIWKVSNGDISETGHPIHFMLGSRLWFLGTANLTAPFKFTSGWPLLPWQWNLRQNRL